MLKNKKLILASIISVCAVVVVGLTIYFYAEYGTSNQSINAAQPLSHYQLEEVKAKLVELLKERGPRASFDYLRSAIKNDTALARECHPLLHHVGHAAYQEYKDFTKTVSYQDGLCNSGYTHGAIEAYFIASSDIQAALTSACPAQNKATFQQWQCYHGVGHGVMYYTGKDVPQSLSLCESLSSDFARNACVNGIFMERFIVVSHSGAPTKNTADTTIALCKQQVDAYKADCYIYAPTAYLEQHINDYSGAFIDCQNAEAEYIGACIYGVGGQAAKDNITRPEVSSDICQIAPRGYVSACIEGIIGQLLNYNASMSPVKPLCSTTFVQFKDACNQSVKSWGEQYSS